MKNVAGKILMLHNCGPMEKSAMWYHDDWDFRISPEFLERTIIELLSTGRRFVSLDEFIESKNNKTGTKQDITITIDDGCKGIYTYAFPIFQKYNIPFTFYICCDFMKFGFDKCWNIETDAMHVIWDFLEDKPDMTMTQKQQEYKRITDLYRTQKTCADSGRVLLEKILGTDGIDFDKYQSKYYCNYDDLREMIKSPLVTIGSHSMSHIPIETLDATEIELEMRDSKNELERELGIAIKHFCYPYGSFNHVSDEIARKYYNSAAIVYLNKKSIRREVLYSDDNWHMPRISLSECFSPLFLGDFYMLPILRNPRIAQSSAKAIFFLYALNRFLKKDGV